MQCDLNQRSQRPRQDPGASGSLRTTGAMYAAVALTIGLAFGSVHADASSPGADPLSPSVPAQFVSRLELPGQSDDFLRPSAVFVDRHFGELLVVDPGHNRIVVLNQAGTYQFEFSGADHFSSPVDVVVDTLGRIQVLASTRAGRALFRFDFDGLYLETLSLETPEGPIAQIQSIALDEEDHLYVVDRGRTRICVYDEAGLYSRDFPVLADLAEELRREQVFGAIEIADGIIYIPIPTLGTVYAYSRSGELIRTIGYHGNNIGELNFPVSVAVQDGLVMVLDKHRFNVVCFTLEGQFLGEFGGKGHSPGWFYHPTILEVAAHDQVYVGQVFQNKIQLCRVPEFIAVGVLDQVSIPEAL